MKCFTLKWCLWNSETHKDLHTPSIQKERRLNLMTKQFCGAATSNTLTTTEVGKCLKLYTCLKNKPIFLYFWYVSVSFPWIFTPHGWASPQKTKVMSEFPSKAFYTSVANQSEIDFFFSLLQNDPYIVCLNYCNWSLLLCYVCVFVLFNVLFQTVWVFQNSILLWAACLLSKCLPVIIWHGWIKPPEQISEDQSQISPIHLTVIKNLTRERWGVAEKRNNWTGWSSIFCCRCVRRGLSERALVTLKALNLCDCGCMHVCEQNKRRKDGRWHSLQGFEGERLREYLSFSPPSHSVLRETASSLCWGLQYKLQENIYREKRKEWRKRRKK